MSLLGTVIRIRPKQLPLVLERLAAWPGTEVALNPGDGRLVLLLEDVAPDWNPAQTETPGAESSAASRLALVASWPEVLSTALVWEYSGPDFPTPEADQTIDFRAWRRQFAPEAGGQADGVAAAHPATHFADRHNPRH